MIRAATGWDFEQSKFYHVTDVMPLIENGIHELRFNRAKYDKMNDTGYGSASGAREALEDIVKWLTEDYEGLRGSWNSEIPLEDIWIAW